MTANQSSGPAAFAAALNRMDDKQVAALAAAFNRLGRYEALRKFDAKFRAMLPGWVSVAMPAVRKDPFPLPKGLQVPLPGSRVGWRRLAGFVPLAGAVLGACAALATALIVGVKDVEFLPAVKLAAEVVGIAGAVIGGVIGLFSAIAEAGQASKRGEVAPIHGIFYVGVLQGGLIGLVVGAFWGLVWWLVNGTVGLTLAGFLGGWQLGYFAYRLAFVRKVDHLLAQAARRHAEGDWALCRQVCERAARLAGAMGDHARRAAALHRLAACLEDCRALGAPAALALPLYAEASALGLRAAARAQAASSLCGLAISLMPSARSAGNWERSAPLLAESARLYADAFEVTGLGTSLHHLGGCLDPQNNPAGDFTVAAALYAEAARWRDDPTARSGRADSLSCQAACLRPDLNPKGSWDKAADLFGEAGRAYGEAGHKAAAGLALHQQAFCLIHGNAPVSPRARELFEQAVRLRREGGDEEGAQASAGWLC